MWPTALYREKRAENHLNWHDYCLAFGMEGIPFGFVMFYIMKIKLINIIQ